MRKSFSFAPIVRDMTLEDVPEIVQLHQLCFADYFLTALGPRVLSRFYQRSVEDSASVACLLEVSESGRRVGLVVGTSDPTFYTQLMRRHIPLFAMSVLRAAVTSAEVRRGVLERLDFLKRVVRARSGTEVACSDGIARPEARLLDIAVHPDWRGGGHAERLVRVFAQRVFAAGAGRVGASVFPQNLASVNLFRRMGWSVHRVSPRRVSVWIDRDRFMSSSR